MKDRPLNEDSKLLRVYSFVRATNVFKDHQATHLFVAEVDDRFKATPKN